MTELKPCPFCGGQPDIAISKYGRYVTCPCSLNPKTDAFEDVSKAIEQWNSRPSPWHTGTPTEEGLYAVYYYADNEYDYGYAGWNGKYWEEHFSFDDIGCRIIAWQKIEPFKEKEDAENSFYS